MRYVQHASHRPPLIRLDIRSVLFFFKTAHTLRVYVSTTKDVEWYADAGVAVAAVGIRLTDAVITIFLLETLLRFGTFSFVAFVPLAVARFITIFSTPTGNIYFLHLLCAAGVPLLLLVLSAVTAPIWDKDKRPAPKTPAEIAAEGKLRDSSPSSSRHVHRVHLPQNGVRSGCLRSCLILQRPRVPSISWLPERYTYRATCRLAPHPLTAARASRRCQMTLTGIAFSLAFDVVLQFFILSKSNMTLLWVGGASFAA